MSSTRRSCALLLIFLAALFLILAVLCVGWIGWDLNVGVLAATALFLLFTFAVIIYLISRSVAGNSLNASMQKLGLSNHYAVIKRDIECPNCGELNSSIAVICSKCTKERLIRPTSRTSRFLQDVRFLRILPLAVVSLTLILDHHFPLFVAGVFFYLLFFSIMLRKHGKLYSRFIVFNTVVIGLLAITLAVGSEAVLESALAILGQVASFLPGDLSLDTANTEYQSPNLYLTIAALLILVFVVYEALWMLGSVSILTAAMVVTWTISFLAGIIWLATLFLLLDAQSILFRRLFLWSATSALGMVLLLAVREEARRRPDLRDFAFFDGLMHWWEDVKLIIEISDLRSTFARINHTGPKLSIEQLLLNIDRLITIAVNSVLREFVRIANIVLRSLHQLIASLLSFSKLLLNLLYHTLQRLILLLRRMLQLMSVLRQVLTSANDFGRTFALPLALSISIAVAIWTGAEHTLTYFNSGGIGRLTGILLRGALIFIGFALFVRLHLKIQKGISYLGDILVQLFDYGTTAILWFWIYAFTLGAAGVWLGIGPFRFGPAFFGVSLMLAALLLLLLAHRVRRPSS